MSMRCADLSKTRTHRRLAGLGRAEEQEIVAMDIDEQAHFPALRRKIRQHLSSAPVGVQIEDLVAGLLGSNGFPAVTGRR